MNTFFDATRSAFTFNYKGECNSDGVDFVSTRKEYSPLKVNLIKLSTALPVLTLLGDKLPYAVQMAKVLPVISQIAAGILLLVTFSDLKTDEVEKTTTAFFVARCCICLAGYGQAVFFVDVIGTLIKLAVDGVKEYSANDS